MLVVKRPTPLASDRRHRSALDGAEIVGWSRSTMELRLF
jgi:hypothetical protein